MPNGEEVQEQDANVQEEQIETQSETQDVETEAKAPETTESTETNEPVQERPVWSMPVAKAQKEKQRAVEKALAEAEAKRQADIDALKAEYESKLSERSPSNDKLAKFAEEHGLDPSAATGLLNMFKEEVKTLIPDTSKYEQIVKEQERATHKLRAAQEFDEKVLPIIQKDFPNVTLEHINKVKEEVVNLAFAPGYNALPLTEVYKAKRDEFEFKNGYSAEASGGRSSELVDFTKVTDEEEIKMADSDPATYRRYLKWLEGKESKYID